ncbi:dual specificity protein phosphatase 13-like isoform X1 [Leptidea sinapis]|uniref:dual specificity protein phosphatase 13-like isoform X1 n=1 Tax=Leptidea sinapis TaxID=189913 RepID=UPI00213CDAB6|nr:dual specificity protein phosphatase 13-like isoform X1 [Leptidea sinapis]
MSYRDSHSLYSRYYPSYTATKDHRLASHLRTSTLYGVPQSSVLGSIATYRSRPSESVSFTPTPDVNEVYPGLFVGDAVAAKDKAFLKRMGINYVLNTAEGKRYTQVDTDHMYYRDCPGLRYKGFQLMDMPSTDISRYFHIAANFIDDGLSRGGRVLVHCFMGVSRSATCALAFLMIKRGMTFTEAVALVRSRRDIHPNEGFVRQLQDLDRELRVCRVR